MLDFLGVVPDNSVPSDRRWAHGVCNLERGEGIDEHKGEELGPWLRMAEHVLVEQEVGAEEDCKSLQVDDFGELVNCMESACIVFCHI